MLRMIPLCLILLITTTCAVHYKKAVDSLRESKECCRSMAEFKYEPIPEGEGINYKIDESSPAFVFQSGKSFFKALTLPKKDSPYYIHVKSFGLGEQIRDAHIFYPQLALLDEKFNILKQSDPADSSLKKAGVAETASISWTALPVKFEGSFFIDSPNARYIVIFTTEKLLNSSSPFLTTRTVPMVLPGATGAIPLGNETVYIPHSPFGILHIRIVNKPLPDPDAEKIPSGANDELLVAASEGNFARVKDLVSQGADVNAKDKFSKTPLIQATSKGSAEIVEFLVGKGADVNAQDNGSWTPLHLAALNNHINIVKFLVENGADVNKRDLSRKTALFHAIGSGNIQIVTLLIDKGAEVAVKDKKDFTPLMEASERGQTEIVKILIAKGADINAKQVAGFTPLWMAAWNLHTDTVKLLINSGSNINTTDKKGRTILINFASVQTVSGQMAQIVKLLLENGADPNIRDNQGKTALMWAKEKGHSEIAKFLTQAGAKE